MDPTSITQERAAPPGGARPDRPSLCQVAFAALVLITLTNLAGCAGYQSYHDGQSQIANGDVMGGIQKLKEASERDPNNPDYRRTYYAQRDQAVNQLARQVELNIENSEFELATDTCNAILRLDPENTRALTSLNRIEVARRHNAILNVAQSQAEAGDVAGALTKTQQVLAENPNHRRAAALLKQFMRRQAELPGKDLGIYPQLKSSYRAPVSLTFTGASLRQAFEALKLASGLNFVFDKDVPADARVTLSVTNKPVEDVLRLLLATNQLERRVLDGDTLLIYPATSTKQADYREMVVRSFYISNADVNKTAAMVKNIAKAKDVFVDDRLNLLVVRDSAEIVRLAEKLIAAQDMAEPEVMLELEVMEVSMNRLLEMGMHWPDSISASVKGAGGLGQLTLDELHSHSKDLVQINVPTPFASATLRSTKGDANLLANPRVRVRNKQSAKILIGQKVPVITTTTTANVGTSESISYLDVGLKLDLEPVVSLDDEVTMKLNLEVSNILDTITLASGTQTYRLGTRNTSTTLRVRDGETNILAGLIQREERNSNVGVPGLNEVPVLSKLFGSAQDSDQKTEIVLLVTPHIVRNVEMPGVGIQEFLSGTENAVGAIPIQFGTPAAPQPARTASPTAAVAQPAGMPPAAKSLPPPASPTLPAPSTPAAPGAEKQNPATVGTPNTSVAGAQAAANSAPAVSTPAQASVAPVPTSASSGPIRPRPKRLPPNIPWPLPEEPIPDAAPAPAPQAPTANN